MGAYHSWRGRGGCQVGVFATPDYGITRSSTQAVHLLQMTMTDSVHDDTVRLPYVMYYYLIVFPKCSERGARCLRLVASVPHFSEAERIRIRYPRASQMLKC